jgi:hypothetical protein
MAREQKLSLATEDNDKPQALQEANSTFFERLKKLFQSGHINFLIGSGASMPAIQVMGNIEQYLTALYKEDTEQSRTQAATKESQFKADLIPAQNALINDSELLDDKGVDQVKIVLKSYTNFLANLEAILNDRKNTLLPKQVNIFTTNYDLFFEKASESIASLVMNDGFDRSPKLNQKFEFSPKNFFNTVFHNGTIYDYKVELPSVNLIKLHGSCSWKTIKTEDGDGNILFDVSHNDPTIILPRKQKFEETVIDQTYYDLLRLYANELDKENALLCVFGFSFADEHILDITRRALKNPTLQVLIFCYQKCQTLGYHERFKLYSNVEVIYLSDECTEATECLKLDFTKLNDILACIPPVKPKSEDKS